MPDSTVLLAFVIASLVVLIVPGPGVLYIVASAANHGSRATMPAVFGLSVGAFVHAVAAAAGLSALLLASAAAFDVVKTIGALYLIVLGIRTLLAREPASPAKTALSRARVRAFSDGVVISILNPKLGIFFLAFLPQFIDPRGYPPALQMLLLGMIYSLLALLTDTGYALLATRLRRIFERSALRGPLPRYLSGTVYIGLGISTALLDRTTGSPAR